MTKNMSSKSEVAFESFVEADWGWYSFRQMLKKRLQWLYTAARVRLWGKKYSSSSWSKSLYPCNWKYSERYSSLLVLSGVVRVFWESLSGGLVMILCSIWNSPGFGVIYPLYKESTFVNSKIKSFVRFCSFEGANENVWHILEVSPR